MTRVTELPDTPDWQCDPRPCTLGQTCSGCAPRTETEPLLYEGDQA